MKISKKSITVQRQTLDEKIKPLNVLKKLARPRSGWIKAIRGALGMTTRQLGFRLGVTHQVILRMEKREMAGAVTLEALEKAAHAMNCKLIYAIVPNDSYSSLDEILDERAMGIARRIASGVDHSMKLENQSVNEKNKKEQIRRLANNLKANLDPRIWEE
ncbi:MAG: mobile mystery protein A [Oligoflexus sp.]